MTSELTIFYAADIHGADVCFKKWLNAAGVYGADVVVIGGDLTGKVLVPLYPGSDGARTATWHGRPIELEDRSAVDAFSRRVRSEGAYAYETTPEEVAEIQGSIERERQVFARLKVAALSEWIAWADERLAGQRVRALVMPGNDDPPEIDAVVAASSALEDVHGRAVELAPGIWMASRGESTPTPWHTPREVPDDDLGRLVEKAVSEIPEGALAIWNVHNPPHNSGVDSAPRLDADLRIRY
jgi:Icc-related predicted phosphoesterase